MTVNTFLETIYPIRHQLYRFSLRMLRNPMDAEDIVQETMIRMWDRRNKLHEYKSIEAFAMTISKNLCLDKIKSKGYYYKDLQEIEDSRHLAIPQLNMENKNISEIISQLIDQLPYNQKMVIQLRDIEHYELDEIANLLEMTGNNVRVTLSRARKAIREKLKNEYKYEISGN